MGPSIGRSQVKKENFIGSSSLAVGHRCDIHLSGSSSSLSTFFYCIVATSSSARKQYPPFFDGMLERLHEITIRKRSGTSCVVLGSIDLGATTWALAILGTCYRGYAIFLSLNLPNLLRTGSDHETETIL